MTIDFIVVDATVSAPPVIHQRPPVSETTTAAKATPAPPPPTATSGPQGEWQFTCTRQDDVVVC